MALFIGSSPHSFFVRRTHAGRYSHNSPAGALAASIENLCSRWIGSLILCALCLSRTTPCLVSLFATELRRSSLASRRWSALPNTRQFAPRPSREVTQGALAWATSVRMTDQLRGEQ